jgi:hypothetical protein
MKTYPEIGVQSPEIMLCRPGTDLQKWAVIACDQFTSQPDYWEQVESIVGDSPSTYSLTFPEVFLGKQGEAERIRAIQATMRQYLRDGTLVPHEGMVYVERAVGQTTRKGILLALDLERYDYTRGSQTLVRATEGTIVERLPPRMRIREGAALELPHILVLIDDPEETVVEPLAGQTGSMAPLYDVDLMLGSGHLRGYAVGSEAEARLVRALEELAEPQHFRARYRVGVGKQVLLFAVGDGNHSLATAKATWEKMKPQAAPDHPARYALVEIENIHDSGLRFEPIHRILFGLKQEPLKAMQAFYPGRCRAVPCPDPAAVAARVDTAAGPCHTIGVISSDFCGVIEVESPPSNLPVGTLQASLDAFLKSGGADHIDYVHGADVVFDLGARSGNMGFYLPALDKRELFRTVILDGALPRKTFSMGEARDKRFYMEARRIG